MNHPLTYFSRLASIAALFGVVASCVQVEQVAPGADSLLPSVREVAASNPESKPFTGLRLESRLAGSLIDLEFAPGVEVTAVTAGSPAESAGIRVGDRLTKLNGATLETVEQFDAVLARTPTAELQLEVERDSGVSLIRLMPRQSGVAGEWTPSHFAERLKARFVGRSVGPVGAAGEASSTADQGGCEIVEILRASPLFDADVAVGDRIVSIDGVLVRDARHCVAEFASRDFGATVELSIARGETLDEIELDLWSPPRRITALSVPILFTFERDFAKDEVSFEFIDLWILAVYGYSREAATRRHEFLWFTIVETGVGEIGDQPLEGEGEP